MVQSIETDCKLVTSVGWAEERNGKLQKVDLGFFIVGRFSPQLCPTLATSWTVARQSPLSMGFPRQEYRLGLPFPPLGDLPNPRIEPGSPALQADSLLTESPGKSPHFFTGLWKCSGIWIMVTVA